MLKVLCVVDKEETAIDRLAQGVAKYHDNIEYVVVPVHPKRPDEKQLIDFRKHAVDADIIDWQYYRTSEMLFSKYPELLSHQKHILTHNNPYGIYESDWNRYDMVIGNNRNIYKELGSITESQIEYIPITVDTDFWKFNQDWQPNNTVIMVANRIESKKGILPVAKACKELGFKFILVGAISNGDYFREVMDTNSVLFCEKITDEELRELYYKSTIHVCNSVDGFESGTMPILESMLCGVPVLTRNVGHVPDLNNGENMVVYEGKNDDVESLTEALSQMMYDKKALESMREKAWQTAKSRGFERRAYLYQQYYRDVLYPEQPSVSVVLPIYSDNDAIRKTINSIVDQTYKNIEIIVADDNPEDNEDLIKELSVLMNIPIRYINTATLEDDYGLARARNTATIEATGEIMVYCDQRMVMEPNAIEEFVAHLKPRFWLYGNKGGKKPFIENFSCVYRTDVISAGMFSERMDAYGGMSQEIRSRIRSQKIQTEYVESAKAKPSGKSSNRNRKRQDIIKMKNRLYKMGLE